jgi:crossover junction endodeoxyribonuclease RuvC
MGIDPGSRTTGYGVVEINGSRLSGVAFGEIQGTTRSDRGPSFLVQIYQNLLQIIDETAPEAVAVEEVFYGKNVKSLIKQGQARGVAILAGAHSGLPIFEYSPLEIKLAVVGYGRAEKIQVQQMVKVILKLSDLPGTDAGDALAVAICHANKTGGRARP